MKKTSIIILVILITLFALLFVGVYVEKSKEITTKQEGPKSINFGTTTTLEATGVTDKLISEFIKEFPKYENTNIKVITKGSGEIFKLGETGDLDFMMTHSPKGEEDLLKKGVIVEEHYEPLMKNHFILVGPKSLNVSSMEEAYKKIEEEKLPYVSRGDESGTHMMEKKILDKANVKPDKTWYKETGSGVEATLRVANETKSYTIVDIGSYYELRDTMDLIVVVDIDDDLVTNIYSESIVEGALAEEKKKEILLDLFNFIKGPKGDEILKNFKVKDKEIFTLI